MLLNIFTETKIVDALHMASKMSLNHTGRRSSLDDIALVVNIERPPFPDLCVDTKSHYGGHETQQLGFLCTVNVKCICAFLPRYCESEGSPTHPLPKMSPKKTIYIKHQ